jgi:hypothetical protein
MPAPWPLDTLNLLRKQSFSIQHPRWRIFLSIWRLKSLANQALAAEIIIMSGSYLLFILKAINIHNSVEDRAGSSRIDYVYEIELQAVEKQPVKGDKNVQEARRHSCFLTKSEMGFGR